MSYAGYILPESGLVTRGHLDLKGRYATDLAGDVMEIAFAGHKSQVFISLEQAVALADAIRALTIDTGKVRPSIQMYSGRYFDFVDVEDNEIEIEDVAHSLSNNCRFGGHCSTFYSVAEHSVRASYAVPPEHAYAALLHDSSEAVMVDLPTPLKLLLRDYQLLETRVERFMGDRFGFQYPLHAEVKRADIIMLATEKRDLKPNSDAWPMLEGVPTLPEVIVPWSPKNARARFLERYDELVAMKEAA